MLHRARHLFIRQQTAVINAIRAHLAEFGIIAPVGRHGVEELLNVVADPNDKRVPEIARACLLAFGAQLRRLKEQILEFDRMIRAWHRSSETSRRLDDCPGVGPVLATALVATVADPAPQVVGGEVLTQESIAFQLGEQDHDRPLREDGDIRKLYHETPSSPAVADAWIHANCSSSVASATSKSFRSGRNFSAWIGLVPKQHSSGGKSRLGSISKQGDRYLRGLFVAGALAVIRYAKIHGTKHRPWLTALLARRPTKVAAIALANKIARMAWAMMAKGEQLGAVHTWRYAEPTAQRRGVGAWAWSAEFLQPPHPGDL